MDLTPCQPLAIPLIMGRKRRTITPNASRIRIDCVLGKVEEEDWCKIELYVIDNSICTIFTIRDRV